jgi:DNA ligase-associated metallophosphoesterase
MEIALAGATLHLLAQRAAYLPEHRTLLVADAHLGKAVSFRRLGVPVPSGTTQTALETLTQLLQATGAQRIVFLGDLLHAARSRTAATTEAVAAWRARHAGVVLTLVRGNHDRHAGDPPPEWQVQSVDEGLRLGPFALLHHPQPVAGAYALAGHVHPAVVLGGRARDRLRLPCFHFGAQVGVLPAFGGFTGMHVLPQAPGDRIYAIAHDSVLAVPVRGAA